MVDIEFISEIFPSLLVDVNISIEDLNKTRISNHHFNCFIPMSIAYILGCPIFSVNIPYIIQYPHIIPTWRFPKRGGSPKSSILSRIFQYKPSSHWGICSIPDFRNPPTYLPCRHCFHRLHILRASGAFWRLALALPYGSRGGQRHHALWVPGKAKLVQLVS